MVQAKDAENILDCNLFTIWKAAERDKNPWIELDFGQPEKFNFYLCMEGYNISIKKYIAEALVGKKWIQIIEHFADFSQNLLVLLIYNYFILLRIHT